LNPKIVCIRNIYVVVVINTNSHWIE
jgi:hypothetical protein